MLPEGSPDFASVGAVMTGDVAAYEFAKLRILNGAHSSLAYLGLLIGHETVADAMEDPELSRFIERLIREDIIPALTPSFDLRAYAGEILDRFRNPAIGHKLSQIAWDGSQKLPYRLLDSVADALAAGRSVERLAVPIAAWMLFVERQSLASVPIVDPLSGILAEIGRSGDLVRDLLGLRQIFPESLARNEAFCTTVEATVAAMRAHGPSALIGEK